MAGRERLKRFVLLFWRQRMHPGEQQRAARSEVVLCDFVFCPLIIFQSANHEFDFIGALEAHTVMSTQALESETVRNGLKDVLLGPAQLYETLRK